MRLLNVLPVVALLGGLLMSKRAPAQDGAVLNHEDSVRAYVVVLGSVLEARERCPGYVPDETELSRLEFVMGISRADDVLIQTLVGPAKRSLRGKIAADGVGPWCANIVKLYGPGGTFRQLLKRSE